MKKYNALLLALTLFLFIPAIVNADCESDFKEVEDKFKATYVYNPDTDDYTITLVNPDYEKYTFAFDNTAALNASNPELDEKTGALTHTIKNFKGSEYVYILAATYDECKFASVKQGVLKLAKGNPYAYSSLCEGYEDFVLCQSDYEKEIDEETFKERLEVYKKTKAEEEAKAAEKKKQEKQDNNVLKNIINFVKDHLVTIIVVIVFAVTLVISIVLFVKRYMKRRRLE